MRQARNIKPDLFQGYALVKIRISLSGKVLDRYVNPFITKYDKGVPKTNYKGSTKKNSIRTYQQGLKNKESSSGGVTNPGDDSCMYEQESMAMKDSL